MQFITRISGNPIALATLLVAVVSVAVGSYLGEHNLIGVGLVGAAVASTTTLVTDLLSKPRIHDVPQSFQQAALDDFENTKFYRSSCSVTIVLTSDGRLDFQMKSRIKRFVAGGVVTIGKVRPQTPSIIEIEHQSHTFNGLVPDQTGWTVNADCSELLHVVYIVEPDFDSIVEDHAWKSPVDGFELMIKAPEGYVVSAQNLLQHPLQDLIGGSGEHQRIYDVKALFSHQGFRWSIVRQDNAPRRQTQPPSPAASGGDDLPGESGDDPAAPTKPRLSTT